MGLYSLQSPSLSIERKFLFFWVPVQDFFLACSSQMIDLKKKLHLRRILNLNPVRILKRFKESRTAALVYGGRVADLLLYVQRPGPLHLRVRGGLAAL
jgi:hypothetical protein